MVSFHNDDMRFANSFIGIITELSRVYLSIYDTNINPFSYTGSEHIDITDNQNDNNNKIIIILIITTT